VLWHEGVRPNLKHVKTYQKNLLSAFHFPREFFGCSSNPVNPNTPIMRLFDQQYFLLAMLYHFGMATFPARVCLKEKLSIVRTL
jgi:hypothetical protein